MYTDKKYREAVKLTNNQILNLKEIVNKSFPNKIQDKSNFKGFLKELNNDMKNYKDPFDFSIQDNSKDELFSKCVESILDVVIPNTNLTGSEKKLFNFAAHTVNFLFETIFGKVIEKKKKKNFIRVTTNIVYMQVIENLKSFYKEENIENIYSLIKTSSNQIIILYSIFTIQIIEILFTTFLSPIKNPELKSKETFIKNEKSTVLKMPNQIQVKNDLIQEEVVEEISDYTPEYGVNSEYNVNSEYGVNNEYGAKKKKQKLFVN